MYLQGWCLQSGAPRKLAKGVNFQVVMFVIACRAQCYSLMPAPEHTCILSVNNLPQTYGRGESCIVHDLLLLSEETPATSLATASVRNAAKLVVVSISADKTLLDTSESADERLGRVMHSVKNNLLHPEGTVAVFVPLPWFTHMGRLHSELPIFSNFLFFLCAEWGAIGVVHVWYPLFARGVTWSCVVVWRLDGSVQN